MRTLVLVAALCALSAVPIFTGACSNSRASDPQPDHADARQLTETVVAMQSDADIKLAAQIRTAIVTDSRVSGVSNSVTILVRGGMVTLQGRVNTAEQKKMVEAVTRAVPGVEKVENLLVVPSQ